METTRSQKQSQTNGSRHLPLNEHVKNAGHHLEELSLRAGQKVGKTIGSLAESTSDGLKSSRDYFQNNPAKGLILAASIGAVSVGLVALALRRRA